MIDPLVASGRSVSSGIAPHAGLVQLALLGLGFLALRIVLDDAYSRTMVELFGSLADPDASRNRSLWSHVLTAITALAVLVDVRRRPGAGNIPVVLYSIFVVLPALSLYGGGAPYAEAGFAVMLVLGVVLVVAARSLVPDVVVPVCTPQVYRFALLLAAGVSLYVYVGTIATGGLARLNFDLNLVYDVREDLPESPFPLAGYLVPWQAHVINMWALVVAFRRRSVVGVTLVLSLQLLLFGMTNYRSFLFAPLLVIALLFGATSLQRVLWAVVGGASLLLLSSMAYFAYTGDLVVPSLFVRRLFFVPAELHYWYFDFFSAAGHPFVMLSSSVLSSFLDYPFDLPVAQKIAWQYMGEHAGANAGLFADAYANFGATGVAVFAVLFGFFLRLVDSVSTRIPFGVAAAYIAVPAVALLNSGLLPSLLTHGFLLAVVVLWINDRPAGRSRVSRGVGA